MSSTLALALAPVAILLFAIFFVFKPTRSFGGWGMMISAVVALGWPLLDQLSADQSARAAGFLNASDQAMAKEEGVVSPTQWEAMRTEVVTKREAQAEAACVADFNCWTNRYINDANRACAPQIEQWAKYDFAWDTSWSEARFTKAIMHNNGKQVSYLGDAIKFQNGLGAWVRANYNCKFDVATKSVVSLLVQEGRL